MRNEEEIRAKALELAIAFELTSLKRWEISKAQKYQSYFWDNVKIFRTYIEDGKFPTE